LFNFLYDNGYIDDNPSARFKFPKVLPQPIEPLTSDEVASVDACFKPSTKLGSRNLAFIHMLLDEGMRSGEIQRLRVKDLNLVDNYIVIRNSKGDKGRILPLASKVKELVSSYYSIVGVPKSDSFVFSTNVGQPLSENAIKCVFQRLKSKSGVARIYPHLLRHTFATSFVLGGGSVEVLRIYMGHSNIDTTQKYLHLANNMRFMTNIYNLDDVFLKKFY
jgi:integrase/recombinase XerC/integrase/recombinase XerD